MATKVVQYLSANCLPCTCKGTVSVILCTIYQQTVPGQIIESSATSGCQEGEWQYQIQYDSDDLPEGVSGLATTDITSVACEGCLVTWIREHDSYSVAEADHGDGGTLAGRADDEEVERLSISITNPSLHKDLVGMILWNFVVQASGSEPFIAAANSELIIDGVAQGNSGSAQVQVTPGGIDFIRVEGASGFKTLTVGPGETVEVELSVTAPASSDAGDGTALVSNVNLGFYGSNTAA